MSNQTPLQKCIAEIEAMRDKFNPMCDEFTLLDKAVETLTANLEYERDVIHESYETGHMEGREGFPPDKADCYKQITND